MSNGGLPEALGDVEQDCVHRLLYRGDSGEHQICIRRSRSDMKISHWTYCLFVLAAD